MIFDIIFREKQLGEMAINGGCGSGSTNNQIESNVKVQMRLFIKQTVRKVRAE